MRPRTHLPAEAVALAQRQHGILGRDQLLALGLPRRAVDRWSSDWRPVHRGVFDTAPLAGPLTWHARLHAGLVLCGRGARASHRTAAHLLGLLEEPDPVIDVLVRSESRFDRHPGLRVHRERSRFRRETAELPTPCTGVADTVLDLCDGASRKAATMWVTRAVQRRLATPELLRDALARRARHSLRDPLGELFDDVATGAETVMEHRYLTDVERAHGLPTASRQVRLADGGVADVVYEEQGVVVELDGRIGHVEERRSADFARDNRNAVRGAATLRFGYEDVTFAPCGTARQVARLLVVRGWTGEPARCARCAGG